MQRYHIYCLVDPRNGKVCYVGHTAYPELRERQHQRLCKSEERNIGHGMYYQWKREVIESGHKPIFRMLESGKGEKWWVRYFAKHNQPLTNLYHAK